MKAYILFDNQKMTEELVVGCKADDGSSKAGLYCIERLLENCRDRFRLSKKTKKHKLCT